jgi:hypothetical protein
MDELRGLKKRQTYPPFEKREDITNTGFPPTRE